MDVVKFILMTLLDVVGELTRRLGHNDLHEKCQECEREVKASEEQK